MQSDIKLSVSVHGGIAKCSTLSIIMLSVFMLSGIMLRAIMQSIESLESHNTYYHCAKSFVECRYEE
jgi:hypothetical protein